MQLVSKHNEAVQAYLDGMKFREIHKKFGVHDMQLYRMLDALGLPRRSANKQIRWCGWCGKTLERRQKNFCCNECRFLYLDDEEGIDMLCIVCRERRVDAPENDCCSSPECRSVLQQRRFEEDLKRISYYAADFRPEEIGKITGIKPKRVRALQSALPKRGPGTLSHLLCWTEKPGAWRYNARSL